MDEAQLPELLEDVKEAVRAAGREVMQYQGGANEQWEKGVDDPVTKADLASDKLLRERLLGLRPECGWQSEETVDDQSRLEKEWVWVVDPLDGTKEFLEQVPEFSIAVALVHNGKPKLGVVFNPATMEMIAGAEGAGVSYMGGPARVSEERFRAAASVAVSRSEYKRGEFDEVAATMHLRPIGSVAYKLALVAAGQVDVFYTLTPRCEWDICAGVYLVKAAGGMATEKDGAEVVFNKPEGKTRSLVAANPDLHADLLEALKDTPLAPDLRA
ncbi:3'(2'),5'-bisphosphate nucleotidase CysQ [Thiohalorhabdus methylotrophus]|uniref:3'(2'),5'-bisphosphate nucleotidase CysQ n=1 Tax=Thiohalorhabdus methylotrophus TaxID=3242694 RepID=A0ABV4TQJ5_9GAMM